MTHGARPAAHYLHFFLITAATTLTPALGCGDGGGPGPGSPDAGAEDATPAEEGGAPPTDASTVDGGPRLFGEGPAFSIAIMPDTQFYVVSYPHYFEAEMKWILQQRAARNIAFALHLGDIVESPAQPNEWQLAHGFLGMLDNVVPYALAAGNHDVLGNREGPLLNSTFPIARFNPHLKGTFEAGKIQNSYYLFQGGDREWLVVSLEFGPRDEVLAWADGVLAMHAGKPAILVTHAYMYLGEQRYDHTKKATWVQYWNPHDYALPGTTNDGQQMWQKVVSKNDNVIFVFSGHATKEGGAVGRLSTRRASGAWVHEMLSNYQGCPSDFMCFDPTTRAPEQGGRGTIRVVRVEPANRRALVETFSTVTGQPRTDPANQFELPLE